MNGRDASSHLPVSKIEVREFNELKVLLEMSGRLLVRAASSSMAPLIQPGESLQLVPAENATDLEIFGVYVYWADQSLICHYLQSQNRKLKQQGESVYIFRGLSNPSEDFPIRRSQILGKVSNVSIPRWRRWKLNLQSLLLKK